MELDLTSFQKAISQLETSLEFCRSDLAKEYPGLAFQLRAAAIQGFEYTYELSWKTLKRYLEMTLPNPEELDTLSFSNLIRTGNEQGLLLSNLEKWQGYRKARGTTSHTYDDGKAESVFKMIPAFLDEARFLCQKLQERA